MVIFVNFCIPFLDSMKGEKGPLELGLIVAETRGDRGIGWMGKLPWDNRLAEDRKNFYTMTTTTEGPDVRNAVIMGRRTWESLSNAQRPLPKRINVVLTSMNECEFLAAYPPPGMVLKENSPSDACPVPVIGGAFPPLPSRSARKSKPKSTPIPNRLEMPILATSLDQALYKLKDPALDFSGRAFIIGGKRVYEEALRRPELGNAWVTTVWSDAVDLKSDVTWPGLTAEWFLKSAQKEASREGDLSFVNCHFVRTMTSKAWPQGSPDAVYLSLVRDVLDENNGIRPDRTGVGTYSLFGVTKKYNLLNGCIPLLSSKKMFWKGVVEELLWVIKGGTKSTQLAERGVHFWDANGTREALDARGLYEREEGDMGPIYGHQWRHYGAPYPLPTLPGQHGVDQLAQVVRELQENRMSRRIIINAWNPEQIHQMALPPCHVMAQFWVDHTERNLYCHMTQRSGDVGLGVPMNIAFYGLLTHMLAHVCDLQATQLIHTITDAHVYLNHAEALKEQLARVSMKVIPTVLLNPAIKVIDEFEPGDIVLNGYKSHGALKMPMAV